MVAVFKVLYVLILKVLLTVRLLSQELYCDVGRVADQHQFESCFAIASSLVFCRRLCFFALDLLLHSTNFTLFCRAVGE